MSGSIDNSELISSMLDSADDGDTFWYTEILDRERRSAGSNRKRLLRMFTHDCAEHLLEVMPVIRALCDATSARAYIRLSPRSRRSVGKTLMMLTAEMVLNDSWSCAPHLYESACDRMPIKSRRTWLYDVDAGQDSGGVLREHLRAGGWLIGVIPSRSGLHYITKPHDPRDEPLGGVALHKDNPTNLYIPATEGTRHEPHRQSMGTQPDRAEH